MAKERVDARLTISKATQKRKSWLDFTDLVGVGARGESSPIESVLPLVKDPELEESGCSITLAARKTLGKQKTEGVAVKKKE
jgi:hypothetical protein